MSLSKFQNEIHNQKSDKWRNLYLKILSNYKIDRVLEIGAGTPDFLLNLKANTKFAFDGGNKFKEEFLNHNIDFHKIDLDYDDFPKLDSLDLIVSSDVFEHLIYPERSLDFACKALKENGIFISHVPNEFYFTSLVKVLIGIKTSNIFHQEFDEHQNPHIRRFTKKGYIKFLKRGFKYNLYISDFYYNFISKTFSFLKLQPPYMFEPGPTFISTNNINTFNDFCKIKKLLL